MSRWLGRVVLKLMGWKIHGEFPPISRLVVIVAPHTSNWDFIVGMAAKLAMQVKATWLGKHTLFFWPLGVLLRALGGIPVDRASARSVTEDVAHQFSTRNRFILALSPEGTRKRVEKWKSGFYRIAVVAEVPMLMISLDYASRTITVGPMLRPTGNMDEDLPEIRSFFAGASGKYPEQFALPALQETATQD